MKNSIVLKANQTILFIGDSITDAGRNEPAYRPLGCGYVHFTANYLLAKYPELNLRIINTGISGNTIRDLQKRWKKDCLNYQPDIVSILIGINDIWRLHENQPDEAVGIEEYLSTYRQLLGELKNEKDRQLILIEPFMFCDEPDNPMFRDLAGYIKVTRALADEFDAVLLPLQEAIDEKIKTVKPEKWSEDMVHPLLWAHSWISQRWLESTKL